MIPAQSQTSNSKSQFWFIMFFNTVTHERSPFFVCAACLGKESREHILCIHNINLYICKFFIYHIRTCSNLFSLVVSCSKKRLCFQNLFSLDLDTNLTKPNDSGFIWVFQLIAVLVKSDFYSLVTWSVYTTTVKHWASLFLE